MIWRSGRLLDEGSARGPSRGALGAIGAPIGPGLGMASVLILAFGAATT